MMQLGNSDQFQSSTSMVMSLFNAFSVVLNILNGEDPSPKPFRVIWNYPDKPCRSRGVDFNLQEFGIEANKEHFVEDTIALYYSSMIGFWPYIEETDDPDGSKHVHGGWPHFVNIKEHLRHLVEVIDQHQSPGSSGFGIIDMELWRPILKTNYGRYAPYKQRMVDLMSDKHPHLDTREHKAKAEETWAMSTKLLMLMSITMAKFTRPYAKWGYYGYPELVTAPDNHELDWLWSTVTAYYPSIYIKNYSIPFEEARQGVIASIAEAFRVRAMFGDPDYPIMAYTDIQTLPMEDIQEWLDVEVRTPLEMGVDGIILWASSNRFRSDSVGDKCLEIKQYIQQVAGPFIQEVTSFLTECSRQMCANRGRCVRKEYALNIPFLTNRKAGSKRGSGPYFVEPRLYKKVGTVFKKDFVCQCYTGWYGKRCVQEKR